MKKYLLKNISTVITCNDQDEILHKVDILIEGKKIKQIGQDLPQDADTEVLNGNEYVAIPGLVNTHHHLYQTMFRGLPEVQGLGLFEWLKGLYEFWKFITPEVVYHGSMVGLAELLRTGCTLTTDHHYVFPKNQSGLIDCQIEAAKKIGIRFQPTRGSMSISQKDGGLPPDSVVQTDDEILEDCARLIEKYHDPDPYAMIRISLAPCSPFSVSTDLMKETAKLARQKSVMMHTHVAETLDEERYCLEKFGLRPVELMEELEWVGPDVWWAHGIHLNDAEIHRLNGTGIAHCPSSNMKLQSGICRTSELYKANAKLGIAVDGSASNDGSNMWQEIKRAYLLNHLHYGLDGLSAYEIIKIATRGGAEVLGRTDTGILAPGMAADIVLINLADIAFAGCHDPLVAIVNCGNNDLVDTVFVNGKKVVENQELLTIDQKEEYRKAHAVATACINTRRKEMLL
jgi:8-oxoguanine deaminase